MTVVVVRLVDLRLMADMRDAIGEGRLGGLLSFHDMLTDSTAKLRWMEVNLQGER